MDCVCEEMNVEFSSGNKKDSRITAQRAVDFHLIGRDGKSVHGSCEKVLYTYNITAGITNDLAVLTGSPVLEAAEGTVTNSVIILDRANHNISAPGKYKMYGKAESPGTNVIRFLNPPMNSRKP
jgi:hypothetical protein